MTGCSLRKAGRAGKHGVVLAAVLLVMGMLAGCGGTPRSYAPRTEFVPFSTEQKTQLEAQRGHVYRIQEGDVLRVRFAYEHSLDQDGVLVLSDGSVSLVGIGPIHVAGLSIAEADSAMTAAYSREYREPALSVIVLDTQGRRVYVLGEVTDPGFYKIPVGGMDVMSAVAMASGFTDDAAKSGTVVVRVNQDGYQFQEVNLDLFGTAAFATSSTVTLEPYDIVYVPRSRSGDFAYFAKSILTGLGQISRIAWEIRTLADPTFGGY